MNGTVAFMTGNVMCGRQHNTEVCFISGFVLCCLLCGPEDVRVSCT